MSLFYLMENEHLAGFKFRQQFSSGKILNRDFSYNLTAGPGWRVHPRTDESLEVYQKHTLHNFFRPLMQHYADYVSTHIKYCSLCFKAQIEEFGFYWFKREWLIYETDVCFIHRCNLFKLNCFSCGCVNSLESFLRGKCSRCSKIFNFQSPTYVSDVPPMILWAHKILESGLPRLSRGLIEQIFLSTYEAVEGNIPSPGLDVAYYLQSLTERPTSNNHPSWKMNGLHRSQEIKNLLNSNSRFHRIPFLTFWKLMIIRFKDFENFMQYINSNGISKVVIDGDNAKFRYLDIK